MNAIKKIFSLDLRSLALFRIGIASIILWDLVLRALYLKDHYTDLGVLPRGTLIDKFMSEWTFSLHLLNGQFYFQATLFIIAALAAISLMLGYRTKLMTIASWFLLVSLQNRNYMILQGGDTVLRLLLFWGMFLPLGAQYSIDRALSTVKEANKRFFSMATVGIIIQIMLIYIFNALTKTHADWTKNYNALWYALHIDQFVLPLGEVLREFPRLCRVLTFLTHKFELIAPLILLVPFKNYILRIFLVISFIGFHIGIASTLNVGLFPFICIIMWPIILPREFWGIFKFTKENKATLYYDKDCGFCKKMILMVQVLLFQEKSKIQTLQSNEKTNSILKEQDTWVVQTHDNQYLTQFDALRYLFSQSKLFSIFAFIFSSKAMKHFGNRIYRTIANNRNTLGKLTKHLQYKDVLINRSIIANALCLFFLVSILLHNYSTLKSNNFRLPDFIKNTNLILRTSQNWKMFAPKPLRNDGWFVIPGKLKNGKDVELFFENKNSWIKPKDIEDMYPTQRWRKYMMNIASKKYKKQRLYFGKWICRSWNREHTGDAQLESFQIYFMLEQTKLNLDEVKVHKNRLWLHNCFAKGS